MKKIFLLVALLLLMAAPAWSQFGGGPFGDWSGGGGGISASELGTIIKTYNTDDITRAELQTILDDIETAGGGAVNIIRGSAPISLDQHLEIGDNTAIVCQGGKGDDFKLADGADDYMISSDSTNGSSKFAIQGCGFDGNKANQTTQVSAIRLDYDDTHFSISNNTFHDQRVGGVTIRKASYGEVTNNLFYNQGYTGLTGGAAIQCHGEDDGTFSGGHCDNVIISDNTILDSEGHGIHLKWGNSFHNIVSNNAVNNVDEDCILLGSSGSITDASHDNIVSDNHLYDCGNSSGNGLDIFYSSNNTATGNYIDMNSGGSYGIQLSYAQNNFVGGNTVVNNSAATGINLSLAIGNNVVGNNLRDSGGIGIERGSRNNNISSNSVLDSTKSIYIRYDAINNYIANNYFMDFEGGRDASRIFDVSSNSGNNLALSNYWYDSDSSTLGTASGYLSGDVTSYEILSPGWTPVISSDVTTFTGTLDDKIKVTIDGTVYDDINIGSATTISEVATAINSAIGSNNYNAMVGINGYLEISGESKGSNSSVTIADGSTTAQPVVSKLFSVAGDRTKTGTDGYRQTNIEQRYLSDLLIDNSVAGGKNGTSYNSLQGITNSYSEAVNGLLDNTSLVKGPYIDSTPAGEWTGTDADFATSTDATNYKGGTGSLKITTTGSESQGDTATYTTGQPYDWTGLDSIGIWMRADQTIASSSVWKLKFVDSGGTTTANNTCGNSTSSNQWVWCEISISAVADADKDDITSIVLETGASASYIAPNTWFSGVYVWDSTAEKRLAKDVVTDGVTSVISIPEAAASDHTFSNKVEYTDFFINYGSGAADDLIPLGDESANSWLVNYQYQ